jgi:hypothetical protein
VDVPTVPERHVDGRHALDICSDNSGGDADGDGIRDMMTDVVMPLIGIVLISTIMVLMT